ncbi:putative DNA polymerase subunit delta-3 [Triangularia setosa]|uniref:DNA polymerase delta subunit 3 n=1 Tax=Triangularia setosa TaxID=2587417 RepID=A0AAN6W7W5_9PEZI|nr:putative DNA polymerase subunit delta-3 [Podospora setosa]
MDTYLKHLSETVLAEDKVVDYLLLSQALQVPVNTAKQMLYEFHRTQNVKRPGSVHATYLIYGVKHNNNSQNGTDEEMPDADSVTDAVPVYHLHLVAEEKLGDVLAEYEEVTTIHVYSVAPHPIKDMALLADLAHEVRSSDKKVPPNIVNPNVRTRERRGSGLKATNASVATVKQQPKVDSKIKEEPEPAEEAKSAVKTEKTAKTTSSAPAKKPAPAKSAGIMAAFSKAASLPKKEPKSSKSASPAVTETNTPALSDEDDDEEEMPQPKPRVKPGFKTKKQREEDLRRMMEEDDEEEASTSEGAETPEEPEPEPEPMEVEEEAPEPVQEEKEVVETTGNGRRRGKRRIMRKKQIMDEQGYLVTIQEPGWESFSEDEDLPPPKVVKTTSSASSTQASKVKKGAAKGQGSIMSFFSKKA